MPGHDKSRIDGVDQAQLDELTCGICKDVLNHPMVTACCRQTYCKDCIEEWLTSRDSCPHDRQPLTSGRLSEVPRILVNLIDLLPMKCELSQNGCEEYIPIGKMSDHVKTCQYNRCVICGFMAPDVDHDCVATLLQETLYLKDQVNQVKESLILLTSENDKLNESNIKLTDQVNSVTSSNSDLQEQLNRYKQDFEKIQLKLNRDKHELDQRNKILLNKNKTLEANEKVLIDNNEALNNKLTQLRTQFNNDFEKLSAENSKMKLELLDKPKQAYHSKEKIKILNKKIEELQIEINSLKIVTAIKDAKGEEGKVEMYKPIGLTLVDDMKKICRDAINEFDYTKNSYRDLINSIRPKIVAMNIQPKLNWTVYLHVNDEQVDWPDNYYLLKLSFARLIVIISGK